MRKSIFFLVSFVLLISMEGRVFAMKFFFDDPLYSFQALRALSAAPTGGADVGEVLSTVYRIKEGDDESWYREWLLTAQRMEKVADGFLAEGHRVSAKEAYFRASNYYR